MKTTQAYLNKETMKLPGNVDEWSCFYAGGFVKVYISEAVYKTPYTIVGVCDGDDLYIRKQFSGHQSEEAMRLFKAIIGMSVIFHKDLLEMGMERD